MTIDDTIREVERLYREVTGSDAPETTEAPFAAIPPEVDPQRYVESQIERLTQMLSLQTSPAARVAPQRPPLTVLDGEKERVFLLDLPGVSRDDVEVAIEGQEIVVSGTRKTTREATLQLRYSETSRGRFERRMPLPRGTDDDDLRVSMHAGCLEIRVPMSGSSSRNIEIE